MVAVRLRFGVRTCNKESDARLAQARAQLEMKNFDTAVLYCTVGDLLIVRSDTDYLIRGGLPAYATVRKLLDGRQAMDNFAVGKNNVFSQYSGTLPRNVCQKALDIDQRVNGR